MFNKDDGYVYVAKLKIPGKPVYKIGHCGLSKSRLAEYTKLPYEIEYYGLWQTSERKIIEYELHNMLTSKRLNGEWFDLDENDLTKIDNYFKSKNIKKDETYVSPRYVWKEDREPDGYDTLYLVKYRHGVFFEEDFGSVPYLVSPRRVYGKGVIDNKVDHDIKRYPTLQLDEIHFKNQEAVWVDPLKSEDDIYLKIYGRSRVDCYTKLKEYIAKRIITDDQIKLYIKGTKKKNEYYNKVINMLDQQLKNA